LFRDIENNSKISGVTLKKGMTEIERMVKALINLRKTTLDPWNPWLLFSN